MIFKGLILLVYYILNVYCQQGYGINRFSDMFRDPYDGLAWQGNSAQPGIGSYGLDSFGTGEPNTVDSLGGNGPYSLGTSGWEGFVPNDLTNFGRSAAGPGMAGNDMSNGLLNTLMGNRDGYGISGFDRQSESTTRLNGLTGLSLGGLNGLPGTTGNWARLNRLNGLQKGTSGTSPNNMANPGGSGPYVKFNDDILDYMTIMSIMNKMNQPTGSAGK